MSDNELPSVIDLGANLEDVTPPPPLPPGQYRAQVLSAERKQSQTSGNMYAKTVFRISPDQYPADYAADNAPNGKSLTYNLVSLELKNNRRAMHSLKLFYEALGLPLAVTSINLQDWVGCEATVTVDNKVGLDGQLREEITRVTRA